jgi:DNA-binding NarL/FixJ family response regulator
VGVQGFQVVGQAGTVQEALSSMEAIAPDAVILDISLPDGSGVAGLVANQLLIFSALGAHALFWRTEDNLFDPGQVCG